MNTDRISTVFCSIFVLFIFISPVSAQEEKSVLDGINRTINRLLDTNKPQTETAAVTEPAGAQETDDEFDDESAAEDYYAAAEKEEIKINKSEITGVTAKPAINDINDLYNYDYDDLASLFFDAPDLIIEVPKFEPRSFDDIFPELTRSDRRIVLEGTGIRRSYEKDEELSLIPASGAGIDLLSPVLKKDPSHIIEALVLVPYNERELDMLDIFNALGRIEALKEHTIPLRSGKTMEVFKDTTRLISDKNRKAIPDPSPAKILPYTDTMYLRFTDAYIGNIFFRGDMSLDLYGITYSLTNFRDINFAIFKIMKADRVTINLYIEPVVEGIMIYSVSGLYLPGFIIKRVNLTPNINARIRVLTEWITEGLREQEGLEVAEGREQLVNTVIHYNRLNRINQMLRVD